MESLSVLDLSNNHIVDLSPLAQIDTLSSLNLDDNDITDLTPLKDLITLANLSLARNQIVDVSPIGTLYNLLSLDLTANQIDSIANLGQLDKLVEFKMRDNVLGTSLEKVPANCPLELESGALVREFCQTRNQVRPFMDYCLNYENESPEIKLTLDRLKTFQTCEETYDRLSTALSVDLSVRVDATFAVQEPELRLTNIWPLAEFTNIENLNLNFNAITNVEPISYITNLKSLKIRGNGFSDISTFSYLENS